MQTPLVLSELSFISTQPLAALPVHHTRLRLLRTRDRDPLDDLRQRAARAKFDLKQWIGFDLATAAIVYSPSLPLPTILNALNRDAPAEAPAVEALATEARDLAQDLGTVLLFQYCNYQFCQIFKTLKALKTPNLVVEAKQRIYSSEPPKYLPGVEAPLYMTYDFNRDRSGRLILVVDFRREYRSRQTLAEWNPEDIKLGQKLRQIHKGDGCEWMGWAPVTISQPLPELGNKSILEFNQAHQGYFRHNPPNPNQRAAQIRYSSASKSSKIYYQLPHLLQPIYDRRDLSTQDIKRLICPISEKVAKATAMIALVNHYGFLGANHLKFEPNLRQPPQLWGFRQGDRQRNLDFGPNAQNPQYRALYDEAWKGWGAKQLLHKPERILMQVVYPQPWETEMKSYMLELRSYFAKFGIKLERVGESLAYNPKDALEIQRVNQQISEACQFVFAFVPDSRDPLYDPTIDPYFTLKRTLLPRQIPSQMVTAKTLRTGRKESFFQNIILGILVKLGYLPWRLGSMPGNTEAFVGLDLGTKNGRTVGASAFVVDAQGQTIGWSTVSLQKGETFSADSLQQILRGLFQEFEQTKGKPLEYLVIHRDGTFKTLELETLGELEAELRSHGLKSLDLVEVVKSHKVRGAQWGQDKQGNPAWINPDRGWGWEHCPREAIVLTTGRGQTKINPNASPKPLLVRHRRGYTDLLTLAEQVYWLSEMHVGSTQTVRLPITTYYADKIAEVTLTGLLPPEVQRESRLYFV